VRDVFSEDDTPSPGKTSRRGVKFWRVVLAVAPDGAGIIQSNVGPEALAYMAELLSEAVSEATTHRPARRYAQLTAKADYLSWCLAATVAR
jgi:hypothetical protein